MGTKLNRNAPCLCGSGKKYKKCCLYGDRLDTDMHNHYEIQRKLQQGLGKPIRSEKLGEYRSIQVGDKIYKGKYHTFHDFLFDYIKLVVGNDWWQQETSKASEQQHPLIKLCTKVNAYRTSFLKTPGKVYSAPFSGASKAYLWLSYNLYIIAHNAKLHSALIERLKDINQFNGAYYETYVAAIFLKAGFELDFEDETDRAATHCEFTATCKTSREKFSVEAKCAHKKSIISPMQGAQKYEIDIIRLVNKALKKNGNYPRIVFIDLNVPGEAVKTNLFYYVDLLKKIEFNNPDLPPAYIFLSNHPYHYNLDSTEQEPMFFAHGFKIPDFGNREISIQEALRSKEKHKEANMLWNSIATHRNIPATFNGEIPSFCFGENAQRFYIGEKYLIYDAEGKEHVAELQQASVDANNCVIALFATDSGSVLVRTFDMNEEEIDAYKQHPDTFFGTYREVPKGLKTPMDCFNFLKKAFSQLHKEELLSRLKNSPSYNEEFKEKTREELLEIYRIAMIPIILGK